MNARLLTTAIIFSLSAALMETQAQDHAEARVAIAIHGGAGTITRSNMTDELEQQYRTKLTEALQAGHELLVDGKSSIEAVTRAVTILEDSPLFNAGVGAVLTNLGTVEHDASIMDGRTLQAGASAATRHIRNPILLARLILESSPHVLLVGDGAEELAREHGLELVDNDYFIIERRKRQLERRRSEETNKGGIIDPLHDEELDEEVRHDDISKYGTVGAVALDVDGNLAAATSTGGISNKRWGRVGDSPIIGAGTYADNNSCAVSSTGDGEYFIRGVIAYDVCATMRLTGMSLAESASAVIHGKLSEMGGGGGVIAVDLDGNIAMPFNTRGMYRGYIDKEGNLVVKIYGN
ncbi:MAG: isoaspartyl peptidase/L-asparaginase [Rhodothermia bacterium]|nr:isoaspartyl peptidase/L-asparaginase [Rhodothermia bacterium]